MPAWTSSLFGNRRAHRPKTTEPATPLNDNDSEIFKLPTYHQPPSVETVTDTVFQHAPGQEPSIQPDGGTLKKSRRSMDEDLIRSLIPFNTHASSVFKPRNLRSQSSSLNKTISGNPSNINSISDINRYLSESKVQIVRLYPVLEEYRNLYRHLQTWTHSTFANPSFTVFTS